jgi:hypothetical protein
MNRGARHDAAAAAARAVDASYQRADLLERGERLRMAAHDERCEGVTEVMGARIPCGCEMRAGAWER